MDCPEADPYEWCGEKDSMPLTIDTSLVERISGLFQQLQHMTLQLGVLLQFRVCLHELVGLLLRCDQYVHVGTEIGNVGLGQTVVTLAE